MLASIIFIIMQVWISELKSYGFVCSEQTKHYDTHHLLLSLLRYAKEDVGLAYVIEKYDARGVIFMIICFICVYLMHITFQRSSFSIGLTSVDVQSFKIVPTSKIHITSCITLST